MPVERTPIAWRGPKTGPVEIESVPPSLVADFHGSKVVVGMEIETDGTFDVTFSLRIDETNTLPHVERFIQDVVAYMLEELRET